MALRQQKLIIESSWSFLLFWIGNGSHNSPLRVFPVTSLTPAHVTLYCIGLWFLLYWCISLTALCRFFAFTDELADGRRVKQTNWLSGWNVDVWFLEHFSASIWISVYSCITYCGAFYNVVSVQKLLWKYGDRIVSLDIFLLAFHTQRGKGHNEPPPSLASLRSFCTICSSYRTPVVPSVAASKPPYSELLCLQGWT